MSEQKIKEKLKQGWMHILVTFEVLGKPKIFVEKSLKDFLESVKKEDRIQVIDEHISKAEEREDGYFSAFAEVDMLAKDFDTLTWIAINYTPASIEVIEPDEIKIKNLDMQNYANDLLSRLHMIGNAYKTQTGQLEYLKENFAKLVRNLIIMSVANKPKKTAQIAKETTLKEELVVEQLKILVKDKTVVEKKGEYSLK